MSYHFLVDGPANVKLAAAAVLLKDEALTVVVAPQAPAIYVRNSKTGPAKRVQLTALECSQNDSAGIAAIIRERAAQALG